MDHDQKRGSSDLQEMSDGHQVSQAVSVAASLDSADLLIDGPKASRELAEATGAHPGRRDDRSRAGPGPWAAFGGA